MKYFLGPPLKDEKIISAVNNSMTAGLYQIIAETGKGLARSQEALDAGPLEAQKSRIAYLRDGGDPLMIPPPSAYAVPEATLDLRIDLHAAASTDGVELMGTPINAESSGKTDLSVSVSSRVKVRFALVPTGQPTAPADPDAIAASLSPGDALKLGQAELARVATEKGLLQPRIDAFYQKDSGKWQLRLMTGTRPEAVLVLDDGTGAIEGVLDLAPPVPTLKTVGRPKILTVSPRAAALEDTVTITGENLGAGLWDNVQAFVGDRRVRVSEASFAEIKFTVDQALRSGPVRVETRLSNQAALQSSEDFFLTIKATPTNVVPPSGYYDELARRGSRVKVIGRNITPDTELRFTGGATAAPIAVQDDGTIAEYEVPAHALDGPIALVTRYDLDEWEVALEKPEFRLRPSVRDVNPKEARAGERLVFRGQHLGSVTELQVGPRRFLLRTDDTSVERYKDKLELVVPPDAGDGELVLWANDLRVPTGVFFLQIPSALTFHNRAERGGQLELSGLGLGQDRGSLRVRFQGDGDGFVVAVPHFLQEEGADVPGRSRLGVTIPTDAVTGPVAVLRSEVTAAADIEGTSGHSEKKLMVWKAGTVMDGSAPSVVWDDTGWTARETAWVEKASGPSTTGDAFRWDLAEGTMASDGLDFVSLRTPIAATAFLWGELSAESNVALVLREDDAGARVVFELWPMERRVFFVSYNALGHRTVLSEGLLPAMDASRSRPNWQYFLTLAVSAVKADVTVNGAPYSLLAWPVAFANAAVRPGLGASKGARWSWVAVATENRLALPAYDRFAWDALRPLKDKRVLFAVRRVTPSVGKAGDEIVVEGSGFTEHARVVVGSYAHPIVSWNPTEIRFKVAPEGLSGALIVKDVTEATNRSEQAISFVIRPQVTRVEPLMAHPGDDVNVYGTNLADPNAELDVLLGSEPLGLVRATAAQLTVRLPEEMEPGTARLTIRGPGADPLSVDEFPLTIVVLPSVRSLGGTALDGYTINPAFMLGGKLSGRFYKDTQPEWASFDGSQVTPMVDANKLPTTGLPVVMQGAHNVYVGEAPHAFVVSPTGVTTVTPGPDHKGYFSGGIEYGGVLHFRGVRLQESVAAAFKVSGTSTARLAPGTSGYLTEFTDPIVYGNKLYFYGINGTTLAFSYAGVYAYDGTTVLPVPKGASGYTGGFANPIVCNGVLYFQGGTSQRGVPALSWIQFIGLMAYDTTTSAIRLVPTNAPDYMALFETPQAVGNRLYFTGWQLFAQPNNPASKSLFKRFFVCDGSPASVKPLVDTAAGYLHSDTSQRNESWLSPAPTAFKNSVFFGGYARRESADGYVSAAEWRVFYHDGTEVKRPNAGASGYERGFEFPIVCGNLLYFVGSDAAGQRTIYECDGAMLRRVKSLRTSGFLEGSYSFYSQVTFLGKVYFLGTGTDGQVRMFGLW